MQEKVNNTEPINKANQTASEKAGDPVILAGILSNLAQAEKNKENIKGSSTEKPTKATEEPAKLSDDFANASQIVREVKEKIDKYLAISSVGLIPSDEELVQIYVNIQMGIADAEKEAALAKAREEAAKQQSEAYKLELKTKTEAAVKAQQEEKAAITALEDFKSTNSYRNYVTNPTGQDVMKEIQDKRAQVNNALLQSAKGGVGNLISELKEAQSNTGNTGGAPSANSLLSNENIVTGISLDVKKLEAEIEAKSQLAIQATNALHNLKPPTIDNPEFKEVQEKDWKEFRDLVDIKKQKIEVATENVKNLSNKLKQDSSKIRELMLKDATSSAGLLNSAKNKTVESPEVSALKRRAANFYNDLDIALYELNQAKNEWYNLRPPGEFEVSVFELSAAEREALVKEEKEKATKNITSGPGSFEFKKKVNSLKQTVSEINDTVKDMAKELGTAIADSLMPTMLAPGAPNPMSSALRLLINTMRIKRSIDTILRLTSALMGIALELGIADSPAIEKIANLVKPMLDLKSSVESESAKAESASTKPADKTAYTTKDPNGKTIDGAGIEAKAKSDYDKKISGFPLDDKSLRKAEKLLKDKAPDDAWGRIFIDYNDWLKNITP